MATHPNRQRDWAFTRAWLFDWHGAVRDRHHQMAPSRIGTRLGPRHEVAEVVLARDTLTLAGMAALLAIVVAAASVDPLRRAVRWSPLVLREE